MTFRGGHRLNNHKRPAQNRSAPHRRPVITTTTHIAAATSTRSLVVAGIAATAAASLATSAVAAAGHAARVSLEVSGDPIPVSGFASLTVLFSLVGLVLAVALRRLVRHPRRTFVRTAVALTALSLTPDVIADAAPSTKILLMLTHLVAAVIVIPAIARRLPA